MKKYSSVVLFAAVAALFVSCNKEMDKPEISQSEGIQVTVIAANPETKTTLESNGKTVSWKSTDKVGFFNHTADVNVQSSAASIDGEGRATFTATVPSAGTYYAYYPYQNETGSNAPTADGVVARIPNEQTPTPTSFDPKADLLLSSAFSATGATNTPADIRFKRLGAFLKIQFIDGTTGTKLSGEYATSVKVQGQENLSAKYRIHGENGAVYQGTGYKAITATYDAGTYALTTAGQYTIIGVRPQTFAAGSTLAITITTSKYSINKTLTMPSDVVLGAGNILPINVTIKDSDLPIKIEKVWERMSSSTAAWTTALSASGKTGAANADFNIAIDGNYVYVPEFGTSKLIWAINVNDKDDVKLVNTEGVTSTGQDGIVYLSCARVVKKSDGTPVLIATNTFSDDNGKLYIWDNGIDNAPRVVTMTQYDAGRRLGDKFTTYGNYEDCWLIFGSHPGNGFVTMKLPTSGTSCGVISRLAIDLTNFATYYPFPGEITRGMFAWHGGDHDGTGDFTYRNRTMTVASTESAIKTAGAHTSTLTKLNGWMADYENNNGTGYNFVEFNGKRYVIWCINRTDTKSFDLIIKEGSLTTDWATIINTAGSVKREKYVGEMTTSWKNSANCAVWSDGSDVYIAVNKQQVGIALYHMSI